MEKYSCNTKGCKNYGKAINDCIIIHQNEEKNYIDRVMKSIENATKEIKKAKENLENAKESHERITKHCQLLEQSYEENIEKMKKTIEEKDKLIAEKEESIDNVGVASFKKQLKEEMDKTFKKLLQAKENSLKEEYEKKEKQREKEQQILREHYEYKRNKLEDEFKNKSNKLRKRKASVESSSAEKSRRLNDSSKSSSSMSPLILQESISTAISPIVENLNIESKKSPIESNKTSSPTSNNSIFALIRKNAKDIAEKENNKNDEDASTPKSRHKKFFKLFNRRSHNSIQLNVNSRSPTPSPSLNVLEQAYFDFDLKTPDQEQTTDDEKTPKTDIKIKSEKISPNLPVRRFSQDMFSSDVIYVGKLDDKDKIYSVKASPTSDEENEKSLERLRKIEADIKNLKGPTMLFPFTLSEDESKTSSPIASYLNEKRLQFEDECEYCNLFYDEIVQKKSIWDANEALNDCNCQGHAKRMKYLEEHKTDPIKTSEDCSQTNCITDKDKEKTEKAIAGSKKLDISRKPESKKQQQMPNKKNDHIIRTKLDLIRKKKDRGLQPDEQDPNCTPAGYWNLTISPRKLPPIRPKLNKNFNEEELKQLQNFL